MDSGKMKTKKKEGKGKEEEAVAKVIQFKFAQFYLMPRTVIFVGDY